MDADPHGQPKGARENPLSLLDLPFTVPATGRYWLTYGEGAPMLLPESPAGSVLDIQGRPDGGSTLIAATTTHELEGDLS